jgi:hypothetical protein
VNPAKYLHTVDVRRTVSSLTVAAPETVYSNVACLVEPLPAKALESVMGRVPHAMYEMTWGTEDIRMNDTVIFEGVEYVLKELRRDTLRPTNPYHVGILARVSGR